jgi:hypothetical protein
MTLRGPSVAMGRGKMLIVNRRELVPLSHDEVVTCATELRRLHREGGERSEAE